ncbi:hypothetical protein BST81_02515 [Leptolyngbya sp. 'hensonii']|nr:hypothetical protein BST81_02515 [Leptolyngbya sp. 'hensonii']
MDSLNEALKWQLSGFDNKYLQRQASDCESFRSEGVAQHDRIFTPLLKDVFIPLRLDASPLSPGLRQAVFEQFEGTTTIWEILARTRQEPMFRQLVVQAWGGYGKTTLLKHIAYLYGKKQQPRSAPKLIPVLLILRKYRDLLSQENPPSLPDLITYHHIPGLPGAQDLQVPPHWARDILKQGKALVMLDGFDEVAKTQRPAVARWIMEQLHQYGKSVFMVTSRPKAYREQDAGDRLELATPFWIKDFDAAQRQEFVEKWYLSQERYTHGGRNTPDVQQLAQQAAKDLLTQIQARQELQDLAKNPLLLNMIVTFHRRFPGSELPKRRVELYREMCRLQLRDRPAARKLETLLTQCEAQTILQMLALAMMQNRWERIDRAKLLQGLTKCLQQESETVAAKDFLEQVVQISELLVEREPDEFEFAHLSFQEYLAATQIAQLKQESRLYDHFQDDWWKPTILLYAAQVNPTTLIREMMQRGAIDLAYLCFQETTKRVDPTLEAGLEALKLTVQTSRYAQLENYLKQGQWREADRETYRLMITTVGKEEGQWFEPEELLNFPCEELKTIDSLWVKYSQGRFGFTVQKKIYLQCGGIPDGQYHQEAWDRFCHQVGWMANLARGRSARYKCNVKFSTTSPRGHLPVCARESGLRVENVVCPWSAFGGGGFSSLTSRLVKCNL